VIGRASKQAQDFGATFASGRQPPICDMIVANCGFDDPQLHRSLPPDT
jgi:hypothetical protein